MFKRPRRLIIKVCRHKFDLYRRLMIFSNCKFHFNSSSGFGITAKTLSVALEVSLIIFK